MRKARNVNGQMRIIEVILSIFVIFFAFAFVNAFAVTPLSPMYETSELERIGHNVLHDLDDQRLLARFVYRREWANITAALTVALPPDVYFNLTIYYLNNTVVNADTPIYYGDPKVFAESSHIASITYVIPGYSRYPDYPTSYDPRILILQLVRG